MAVKGENACDWVAAAGDPSTMILLLHPKISITPYILGWMQGSHMGGGS